VYKRDGNPRIWLHCSLTILGLFACIVIAVVSIHATYHFANQEMECHDSAFRYVRENGDSGFDGVIFENGSPIKIEDLYEGLDYVILGLDLCQEIEGYLKVLIQPVGLNEQRWTLISKGPDGVYQFTSG